MVQEVTLANPNPFEIGRQVGNNFAKSFRETRDQSTIERILSQAQDSGDPAVLQKSIGQILSNVSPERQPLALQYIQKSYENVVNRKKEEQAKKAAEEGGYTYGAPSVVQTAQVKAREKAKALSQYGIGGEPQSGQIPTGNSPNTNQSPNQPQPKTFEDLLNNSSKDKLIQMTGSPYREVSEPAKATLKKREEEEILKSAQEKQNRKEQIEFHKETAKYDEELLKNTQIAKKQLDTISDVEKSIKSGKVSPFSVANIFKGLGPLGDKFAEAMINNDQATILASIPQLLEGWKQIFGVRLSDADLRLLQDKLPSIGKSPEANLAITKIMKKYGGLTLLRQQIAKDIKEKNGGLRPLGYVDKIEERFDQMTKPIKIINPSTGNEIEIPAYQLSNALESGAILAPEKASP
jgi:hypothetical protein